jgi:uncharacterized membrane protein
VEIASSVEIERPVAEVFAFVADARNDPRWCPKVVSVDLVGGGRPGPGARYAVVHRPVPLRPAREMAMSCVGWAPPERVEWHEDDGTDVFRVTYELEDLGGRTRVTQRSDAEIGAPRVLRPLFRAGIGRDVQGQLRRLKRLLEADG